jgi:hypothetical protein
MCGLVCPSRTSEGWLVQAQSPAQRGSGAHPPAGYVCFLQVCVCVYSNDVDPLETPYTGSTLDLIYGQVHPFHGIE